MKYFMIMLAGFSILLFSCKSDHSHKNADGDWVGKISESNLQEVPFSIWFDNNSQNYSPDSLEIASLQKNIKDVSFIVVLGTWCPDSRRETPRLFKILHQLQFPEDRLTMIAVDKNQFRADKKAISALKGLKIIRVPTIILYRDNKELGRIIEYPVKSLEKDMNLILSSKEYRPNYYEQWQSIQ